MKGAFPLRWPVGWQRTPSYQVKRLPTGKRTVAQAMDALDKVLFQLGASDAILCTDLPLSKRGLPLSGQAQPKDKGAVLTFRLLNEERATGRAQVLVIACDSWDRVEDNIFAIAQVLDATRVLLRYRVAAYHRTFLGWQGQEQQEQRRPPPRSGPLPRRWYEILGVALTADMATIKSAYRRLARENHPDHHPGDKAKEETFKVVAAAYEEACRVRGAA